MNPTVIANVLFTCGEAFGVQVYLNKILKCWHLSITIYIISYVNIPFSMHIDELDIVRKVVEQAFDIMHSYFVKTRCLIRICS